MEINVIPEVLTETKRCGHGFCCLETGQCGGHPLCVVKRVLGKNLLYLLDKEKTECAYRMAFGFDGQFCTCPTHYAISDLKFRDR